MCKKVFQHEALYEGAEKWQPCVTREEPIDSRKDDIRTDFERDYNRILHCHAYRRMKSKTQVFFATQNERICTRIEHVNHVASVSSTIAGFLGLNTQLALAIAIGHDLGHAPFGHCGEHIIQSIALKELKQSFWHEKNSLRVIDCIETLEDSSGNHKNMNLTYAVRDGIVLHCGEVDENSLKPRKDAIPLELIEKPNQYAPFTWEACVVKIADKISYLGRDIEDALTLKILTNQQLDELKRIVGGGHKAINNTILMHDLITDLCKNSNPEDGICFSDYYFHFVNKVKGFNYEHIYNHKRLRNYEKYARLIIETIYETLMDFYDGSDTPSKLSSLQVQFPLLTASFNDWLLKYDVNFRKNDDRIFAHKVLYDINRHDDYVLAVIDYIASLTDYFAIDVFNELSRF